jgi:hypothetical protein
MSSQSATFDPFTYRLDMEGHDDDGTHALKGITSIILTSSDNQEYYHGNYVKDCGYKTIGGILDWVNSCISNGSDNVVLINLGLGHSQEFLVWISETFSGRYIDDEDNMGAVGYLTYHVYNQNQVIDMSTDSDSDSD